MDLITENFARAVSKQEPHRRQIASQDEQLYFFSATFDRVEKRRSKTKLEILDSGFLVRFPVRDDIFFHLVCSRDPKGIIFPDSSISLQALL